MIPSENQLAGMFGVSRMTARKAITGMQHEGYVFRVPGKGTFVRKREHYTEGFFRVRPFRRWAEDLNLNLTSKVLNLTIMELADGPIAEMLQYRGQVIHLNRMNYFDEKPVRHDVMYLRGDLCAGILTEDFEKVSVQEILMTKFGLAITKIEQNMVAVGLPAELSELFHEPAGYPVFHFKRTTFTHDTALSYIEYTMRGDMAFKDTFSPQVDPADFRNLTRYSAGNNLTKPSSVG